MRRLLQIFFGAALLVAATAAAMADPSSQPRSATDGNQPLPEEYSCTFCHADGETFRDDTENLLVTADDLAADIHWKKGLRCHDCHGGNPNLMEFTDHRNDPGFRSLDSPADIPAFCGHCHSDITYMRRYSPSPRTDQEAEYWTSGHGLRLKAMENAEEARVATCIDCHSRHGILAVDDQKSPIYPTNVAKTCAACHSDPQLMAERTYHGRPLGHDQYDRWRQSVHGRAMLEKGDLSAPTCNDCHGNHGAVPPEVDSVANACGHCHGKVSKLFTETRMKHRFEEVGLPGCAACHGNHETLSPTDAMLGMDDGAVCVRCHEDNKYGATMAGANVARSMRNGLEELKRQIAETERKVHDAERLGMEVRGPRFDLRQARDALTNARSLVHSFAREPVGEALSEGLRIASEVRQSAEKALREHTYRRVWLAGSLVPILLVVCLLLLHIRSLPPPSSDASEKPGSIRHAAEVPKD